MAEARPKTKPKSTLKRAPLPVGSRAAQRASIPGGSKAEPRASAATAARRKPSPPPKPKRRLPVVAAREQVGCLTCGLCCTYLAVGIDGPVNAKAASEILWHLYHEGISIYRDGDNEWMVQFESRCRHLLDDNKCAIYEQRPHICRDYSEESCEVNADGVGTTFYSPAEFLSWLEKNKKRVYKAIADQYLPPADKLGRTSAGPSRHEPFEARFNRLRALGEPKPQAVRAR